VSDYEDYQRDNYGVGQGYEGPPVPLGWGGPRRATSSPLSVGSFPALEFAAYSQLPAVRALPSIFEEDESDPEADEYDALSEWPVISPGYRPYSTVYEIPPERVPEGIYETNRAETDWERVYDEYVVLNAPVAPQEEPVLHGSIDWGNVVGTIVGGAADPFGAGRYAASLFDNPIPPVNPLVAPAVARAANGTRIDPRTGRPVCRRRRRRRLLTDGDFNDLMRISTLPNKDIVKIALAKAVGR
jgi:hypothetical protein